MNKASKKMLRCLSLVSVVIIVMGFTSCSKFENERNAIEAIPSHEAVLTVDGDNLSEESDDEKTVDQNDQKNSVQEIDGRDLYARKNPPEAAGHGPGAFGNMKYFTEIRDIEGTLLTTIEDASSLTLVENGIVYNWIEKSDEKSICSYYYYDFDSKETTMLGSVENLSVVMSYDNMCIGNKLYILLNDSDKNTFLCIIDTKELTFKKVALGTNLSMYCSMTYYDGFVYYFTADTESTEAIYRYDPSSDEITKVWDYSFDAETFTGDTLLHLATDTDHLYVLKAESQGKDSSRLFVDMYDNKLDLIKRIELTDRIHEFTKDLITEEFYGKERAEQLKDDEVRQPVYGFDFRNGVLYYENRSLTRLLEEFDSEDSNESNAILQMNCDMVGAKSTEITSGDYCFYDIRSQCIYLYDPSKSKLQTGQLKVDDETVKIDGILYGRGGKLLIYKRGETGTLSTRTRTLYYLDKTELAQVE